MTTDAEFDARLTRLEATDAIRQLAARYAKALDQRDVDALVALFVDDVRTGNGEVGREALARWFDPVLRPYKVTFHLIGNHVIDFVDDTHATGVVYCRPEHEVGDKWIVMPMQYWDRYEQRDGAWYFRSRRPFAYYAADVEENPLTIPDRFDFPGNPMLDHAELPERFESWRKFWDVP